MPTILVVDDDADVRRVLRKLLEAAGLAAVETDSGTGALALVAAGGIDAIVSDVRMPGIDGVAFYDRLAREHPGLSKRLVFLTGAAREASVHDLIQARGVPLVSKLSDLSIAVDAVRVALLSE